jgi:hypothetical protein
MQPVHFVLVNINVGRRFDDLKPGQLQLRLQLLRDITWPSVYAQEPNRVRLVPLFRPGTESPLLDTLTTATDCEPVINVPADECIPDAFTFVLRRKLYARQPLPSWIITTRLEPGDCLGAGASFLLCRMGDLLSCDHVLRLSHGYEYNPWDKRVRSVDEWSTRCVSLFENRRDDAYKTALGLPVDDLDRVRQVVVTSEPPAFACLLREREALGRPWEPASEYGRYFGPGFADWQAV